MATRPVVGDDTTGRVFYIPLKPTDIYVAVIDLAAVSLQLYLLDGEDGACAVPVVLKRNCIYDEDAVQTHGDAVADHIDVERVPLAQRVVGHTKWCATVLLIVVEPARANLCTYVDACYVPYLYLRCAAQVNAGIRFLACGV